MPIVEIPVPRNNQAMKNAEHEQFEARLQSKIAELPAQPDTDFLAQARHDIDNLFENAVDWLSFNQSDPKFEKARAALCRVEALALYGYTILHERTPDGETDPRDLFAGGLDRLINEHRASGLSDEAM